MTASSVGEGNLVVDVGAGNGAITRRLLETGARVQAIELHPGRAEALRSRFGTRVRVIEADIECWRWPTRPYFVVANPPFGMLATLLRRITAPGSRLVQAHLVVPAHFAARCMHGASYLRSPYSVGVVCRLPAHAFTPAATTTTAVICVGRGGRS